MRRKSFTYAELLIVITVLAVLVAVSFPRLHRNIKQSEFRTFSNKIYLLLDYSKNLAVLNSKSFKVLFNPEERDIEVIEVNQEENKSVKRINILSGFTVSSKSEAVIFYPDGSSSEYNILIKDGYGNEIEFSS